MADRSARKVGHGKVTPPAEHTFLDPAEIAGRDVGTGAHPAATNFRQKGPDDTGGDADDPSFKHLSGDFKFSNGPGK